MISYFNDYISARGITKTTIFLVFVILLIPIYYLFDNNIRLWYLSIILSLIFLGFSLKLKVLKPSLALLVFCLISSITITLSYYLLDRFEPAHTIRNLKTYQNIIDQFFWFIPFITLPTIYYYGKFKEKFFFGAIFTLNFFAFIYISYHSIRLDFNRGQLAQFFDPIISFDMTFSALALTTLCYGFYLKNKMSYLFVVMSSICIFSLMLHGSRGTWLGLPIAALILTFAYFRTEVFKLLTLICLIIVFLAIHYKLPHSPIFDRIQHLKSDAALIENQSFQNSTGTRLMLWKSSIQLFETNPIWGVGIHQIEENNCQLYQQKRLDTCYQHQHSIYFQELAAHGLLGFLGLLITLLVPMFYFARHIFIRQNGLIKNLAVTGFIFVLYHAISGLTEYYLFFKYPTFLYFFIVASLMSFIQIRSKLPSL